MSNSKSLRVLFIANGIFVFASTLLGPLYVLFTQEYISQSINIATFSWAIFLLSSSFVSMIIGKFGNKLKETEYFLILGYILRGFVWILFPIIDNFVELIIAQIVIGIGEAVGSPAYDSLFARHVSNASMIKDYSNWKIISNISNGIAVICGGFVVQYFGFEFLFPTMGILALVSGIIILVQPRKLL